MGSSSLEAIGFVICVFVIVAITAAMPSGTGVDKFGDVYPERSFDVGIAEQHGVTFAAGLATVDEEAEALGEACQ